MYTELQHLKWSKSVNIEFVCFMFICMVLITSIIIPKKNNYRLYVHNDHYIMLYDIGMCNPITYR